MVRFVVGFQGCHASTSKSSCSRMLMHASTLATSTSVICVCSQEQKQHINLFWISPHASNMLAGGYVVMTFYSVHSCSPVTYYAASKLPASLSDSLPLMLYRDAQHTSAFSINGKRHSVFFSFWFFLSSTARPVTEWCVCRNVGTCILMTLCSTPISSR